MAKSQLALIALLSLLGSTAIAAPVTTITTTGNLALTVGPEQNTPGPGESMIFLDPITGTSVTGHVGSQTGTPLVSFVSDISVDAKSGFASIDDLGSGINQTPFHTIRISVPGFTFTDLVFDDLQPENFTVTGSNGGTATVTNAKNGDDEFLALATGGTSFSSLTLASTVGFTQLKHFEISGLAPAVPEPATWAMLLVGFAGVGFMAYRRKQNGQGFRVA